jgi:formylglycine-generating enzyme
VRRIAFALALGACSRETPPPEGQLVVHVTTDAPSALFDRLALDVFTPGAAEPCNECSRELEVDPTLFAENRASFGVVTPVGESGYLVRVRLFRSLGHGPRPASSIEKTVLLPAVVADRVTDVGVVLRVQDVAVPLGPVAPDPIQALDTWPGTESVPCSIEPEASEVCVPGGAYWMGDPTIDTGDSGEYDGRLERLVLLAPFLADRHEVTVAEFRASGLAEVLVPGGPSDNPHEANTGIASCTYTSEPGSMEEHPVNCISWSLAAEYCAAIDRRLPTEAELEYLISARGRFAFPWGNQAPDCEGAVYGRETDGDECASLGIGTLPVGSATLDRSAFATGELVDLAGNVREWADDRWQRETEACWGTGLFQNPRCTEASPADGDARVVRGGGFESPSPLLRSALRTRIANESLAVSAAVGFRCVRSAVEP